MWDLASGLIARGRKEAGKEYCNWIFKMWGAFMGKPCAESDLRQYAKELEIPDDAISEIIDAAKDAKICMS